MFEINKAQCKGIASLCTPAPEKPASTADTVSASFSGSVSIHLHQSQEVDTEYACGDYRSKYWVQTRYFLVNRPHFKQFFLLSV